jgi:tRNA pseudouridine38-40 synthase
MVANVFLFCDCSADEIRSYVNRYLPDDIAVLEVQEVGERFHARYNATGKTYQYTLYNGADKPVFDRKYVWKIDEALDLERMKEAANILTGTHDFAGFCKNPQKRKSTVRTVDRIEIKRNGDYVTLNFHGDGFLHHMVRIMTGTLVEVGLSKRTICQVENALVEKDRQLAGVTAPAQGLCLMEMDYPAR